MADRYPLSSSDVLLVVDLQNDFCPAGALPVPEGDQVVAPINAIARKFEQVLLTQDWHPRGHMSFASSHPGRKPFDCIATNYGDQVLWPDHCVQSSQGAAFHADLDIPHAALVLRKGYRRKIDSYSAFFDNDRRSPTGLAGYLRERGFSRVFIAGLALDYCVRFTAEDAATQDFTPIVIEDLCRAIDVAGSVGATRDSFARLGIACIESTAIGTD